MPERVRKLLAGLRAPGYGASQLAVLPLTSELDNPVDSVPAEESQRIRPFDQGAGSRRRAESILGAAEAHRQAAVGPVPSPPLPLDSGGGRSDAPCLFLYS